MAILDFTEIPQANQGTGKQDDFELFCRDFLEYLGYRIISEPDRGQDDGIDILVEEKRVGIAGETIIRWLVSCKHYAHYSSGKGKSVGVDDEQNLTDRIITHKCDGFIGFYSTIASSGLADKIEKLPQNPLVKEFQIFHRGKIENELFKKHEGIIIAKRYFPISMQKWKEDAPADAIEFGKTQIASIRQAYYDDYLQRKKSHEKN
jgi:hypothetical protein